MINFFNKKSQINIQNILSIVKNKTTPLWIYHTETIIHKIKQLKKFDIIRFAQKACSNVHILRLMKKMNVKIDAVSLGEIERAIKAGYTSKNDDIIFTADMFTQETLEKIVKLNITVNAGSIDMLEQLGKISPGHKVWIRINPKFGHGHHFKTNTGGENSKHGIWDPQLTIPIIKKYKLKCIGLHMHIGSGVNYEHLKNVCNAMKIQCIKFNQKIKAISAGGGLSIPYKTTDIPVNVNHYFDLWNNSRKEISKHFNCPIKLEIEPGRFLVGESGILISQICTIKKVGKKIFTLIDAGFNDLMRPVLYGSYHHVSVIPKDNRKINTIKTIKTIIGGPLCESGDIFTQNKNNQLIEIELPEIKIGDYIIFHNTGAYGASMSSNYNSRPLISEILITKKIPRIIRRRQTIEELIKLEIETEI